MKPSPPDNDIGMQGDRSLQAVGKWFREIREQRGESLDDVAKVTRIGKTYLEAIEEGACARLPSQAYARGFIRLYASHLGLSQEEALAMAGDQATKPLTHEPQEPRTPESGAPLSGRKSSTRKLPLIIVCGAVLAVIALFLAGRDKPEWPSAGDNRKPVTLMPSATAPPLPVPAPLPPASPPAAAETFPQNDRSEAVRKEGIVLRLKAVSDGRLHITIDGSISQEYYLVSGDLVEWMAESMFILDLEDAGSVEGELDGKPLNPLGQTGKAAHLIVRRDGVHNN